MKCTRCFKGTADPETGLCMQCQLIDEADKGMPMPDEPANEEELHQEEEE